jgi:phosphoribosyl 1,2-cyclic phosphodiesterase
MGLKFCSLFSGSDGNSQYIEYKNTKLLIDSGMSGKRIQEQLKNIEVDPKEIQGIFITHEHTDHIKGAGVLSRRYDIPVYANEKTWEAMLPKIGKMEDNNIKVFETSKEFAFNGFTVTNSKKKICLLTDTGVVDENIKNSLEDFDLLLLETNHDVEMLKVGSYPFSLKKRILSKFGHLSNETAGYFLTSILKDREEVVLLGHLSAENNFPELAEKTVNNILEEKGIIPGKNVKIEMTYRDRAGKVYTLK